ncbi:MAG: DEAD/DEAH box helicase [Vulcanimicrobiaceae bacterium]|jgi:superfamily II DNA/RNA helicase
MERRTIEGWLRADFRGRLRAEGLARDLIWKDGELPNDAPRFRRDLSRELIDYAFGIVAVAMDLHERGDVELAVESFDVAAQCIASVVRSGPKTPRFAFLTVLGGAAFHLARQNAMATVLLSRSYGERSESVELFVDIITHQFGLAREHIRRRNSAELDEQVTEDPESIADRALETSFRRSIASVLAFFATGELDDLRIARERLRFGVAAAGRWGRLEPWWLHRLTDLLLDDFEKRSLYEAIPLSPIPALSAIRNAFIRGLASRPTAEVDLWPSQLVAVDVVFQERDLVLALPTSAGKTRIAELCMLPALAADRKIIYVSPLRALSAQIERELRDIFSRLGAGITVSRFYEPDASETEGRRMIEVCTPERLDFAIRHDPSILDNVGLIVLDEAHLIGPEQRELRYELLIERILRLRKDRGIRIACLSALLPSESVDAYAAWLGGEAEYAEGRRSDWRPSKISWGTIRWKRDHARLDLELDGEHPFIEHLIEVTPPAGRRRTAFPSENHELLLAAAFRLIELGESVLIFCPNRVSVEPLGELALKLERKGVLRIPPFDAALVLPAEQAVLSEWLGGEHRVTKAIMRGIAVHHGQLPSPVRAIMERIMRERKAVLTIASPTIAQGLNVSASTVMFESLYRMDRTGTRHRITTEEFQNVVGRAGRAFVDLVGKVVFCTGMQPRRVRPNERDWLKLRSEVIDRQLESGLATLIWRLLERLGGFTEDRLEFLVEHVNIDRTMNNEMLAGDNESQYEPSVDELDAAINALLEGADIAEEDVASRLDAILHGSLFGRTLERKEETVRRIVTRALEARARTIVRRFTPRERSSAYVSGVAPRLSKEFSNLCDALAPAIAKIEEAIDSNTISEEMLQSLAGVAIALLRFPTFATPTIDRVDQPNEIARLWLSGAPLGSLMSDTKAVAFMEDGVRTRAVWAYEAIRRATQGEKDTTLSGATLLVTGTPNVFSALLVREGLDSRSTAVALAALLPPALERRTQDVRKWLNEHEASIGEALQDNRAFRAFWSRFSAQVQHVPAGVLTVATFGDEPAIGDVVFVFIQNASAEVTDRDLRPFARAADLNFMPGTFTGTWIGNGCVNLA